MSSYLEPLELEHVYDKEALRDAASLKKVAVIDSGEVHLQLCNSDGDPVATYAWPFGPRTVYPKELERAGFRVEYA